MLIVYLYTNEIVYFSLFSSSMSMNSSFSEDRTQNIENRLYFLFSILSFLKIVENIGVEPMTSCVQGRRSSQLS